MVDPKDLRFFEYGMYHLGQRSSRLKVRAEWLLDDHPGPLGQLGLAEHVDDGPERGRRHGEGEQPPRAAADLLLRLLYPPDPRPRRKAACSRPPATPLRSAWTGRTARPPTSHACGTAHRSSRTWPALTRRSGNRAAASRTWRDETSRGAACAWPGLRSPRTGR